MSQGLFIKSMLIVQELRHFFKLTEVFISNSYHGPVIYEVLVTPSWRFIRLNKPSVDIQNSHMITLQYKHISPSYIDYKIIWHI